MHLTSSPVIPYPHKVPSTSQMRYNRGMRVLVCNRFMLQVLATAVLVSLLLSLLLHKQQNWQKSRRSYDRRVQDGEAEFPNCVPAPPKRILLWTSFWGNYSEQWEKIFFRQVSRQCPMSACELVYDHRHIDTADAIVFHAIDFVNTTDLPSSRPPWQQWVFFSLEAPPVVNLVQPDYSRLKGVINWTMTYRRDSDIVVPYGMVTPDPLLGVDDKYVKETQIESPISDEDPHEESAPDKDYWKEKSPNRMVAWMVSHCSTAGRREWFAKELVKHISVNVFGRCGFQKCGKNISIKTIGTFDQEECNQEISSYFFYLAFENSICDDYVTEKFFMALTLDVIPVVFGGADYAAIAPPRSYINALEFQSPKMLAKALTAVASNRTLYNSFFAWKNQYTVELGHPFLPMVCDLCAKLNGAPMQHLTRQDGAMLSPDGLKTCAVGRDPTTGSYSDVGAWFDAGSNCRHWWAGPSDYRRHQQTREGIEEPKENDIISHVEEENKEEPK